MTNEKDPTARARSPGHDVALARVKQLTQAYMSDKEREKLIEEGRSISYESVLIGYRAGHAAGQSDNYEWKLNLDLSAKLTAANQRIEHLETALRKVMEQASSDYAPYKIAEEALCADNK